MTKRVLDSLPLMMVVKIFLFTNLPSALKAFVALLRARRLSFRSITLMMAVLRL